MTDPSKQTVAGGTDREGSLRDARLAQALRHMPDADMQPRAQTRQAVLHAALQAAGAGQAARPSAQRHWWHRWVGQSEKPRHSVPWSAALASVLVVGFVAVLWQGQEVPDAEPDRAQPQRSAAVQPDTAATPTLQVPAPAPVVADALKDKAKKKNDAVLGRTNAPRQEAVAPAAVVAEIAQAQRRLDAPAANMATLPAAAVDRTASVADTAAQAPAPSAAPARSRAEERVAASRAMVAEATAPVDVVLTVGAEQTTVPLAQAGALLAQLRGLPFAAAPLAAAPLSAKPVAAGAAAEMAVAKSSGAVAAPQAKAMSPAPEVLTVELPGQGRWVISPHQVRYQPLVQVAGGGAVDAEAGSQAKVSALTAAQYADLRRRMLELGLIR
jgi:hypothetical protein